MNENKSTQVNLIAWKTPIEVMEVKVDVEETEYCNTLVRMFNNKREHKKSIIDLYNTWANNTITFVVNLNYYENGNADRNDTIEHIVHWANVMCNYKGKVEYTIGKGYLYEVDEYRSKIEYFDKDDNYQYNFIKDED